MQLGSALFTSDKQSISDLCDAAASLKADNLENGTWRNPSRCSRPRSTWARKMEDFDEAYVR